MIHVKVVLFICLSLILSACAFHEKYPPDWAPLVKPSKDCFVITGKYNDYGSTTQPSLSIFLAGQEVKSPNLNTTDYIEIKKGDNEALIVTVWNVNTKLSEQIYKKEDYRCSDEGMEISKGAGVTTEWVLGLGWAKVTLIKATDGSLVVKYKDGGFGLFGLLFPVAVSEIRYYKYSQKK